MDSTEGQVEVFDNDIDIYLEQFCQMQNITDMKKESQSVWNAAMMYIRRHVFTDKKKLKTSKPLEGYGNKNQGICYSNCNSYDPEKVNAICDYYIYLCMLYDKEVSIYGFSSLTGISDTVIYEWGQEGNRKLTAASADVFKKLHVGREESLSAKLATGNKNPVGPLAILNRHYQWNLPGVSREHKQAEARTPEQIAAEYGKLSLTDAQSIEMPE